MKEKKPKVRLSVYVELTALQLEDLDRRARAAKIDRAKTVRRALWPPYGFAPGEIADEAGGAKQRTEPCGSLEE